MKCLVPPRLPCTLCRLCGQRPQKSQRPASLSPSSLLTETTETAETAETGTMPWVYRHSYDGLKPSCSTHALELPVSIIKHNTCPLPRTLVKKPPRDIPWRSVRKQELSTYVQLGRWHLVGGVFVFAMCVVALGHVTSHPNCNWHQHICSLEVYPNTKNPSVFHGDSKQSRPIDNKALPVPAIDNTADPPHSQYIRHSKQSCHDPTRLY